MTALMEEHYPDGAPVIIQVAFKHGYGPAILELNKKAYFHANLSFSPVILEAVQALCLSSCENKYCAVMHTRGLISLGFTLDDIKAFIELQRLPDFVEGRELWEPTLRKVATLFREPQLATPLYKSLKTRHSRQQVEDIGGVVAFSLLHKFLLERYSDEIVIETEPILFQTIDCGEELIAYFQASSSPETPIFTICCECKDIKAASGWLPVERALPTIPPEALFSHGYCEQCLQRLVERTASLKP